MGTTGELAAFVLFAEIRRNFFIFIKEHRNGLPNVSEHTTSEKTAGLFVTSVGIFCL